MRLLKNMCLISIILCVYLPEFTVTQHIGSLECKNGNKLGIQLQPGSQYYCNAEIHIILLETKGADTFPRL